MEWGGFLETISDLRLNRPDLKAFVGLKTFLALRIREWVTLRTPGAMALRLEV
jgi:hypothetical protein